MWQKRAKSLHWISWLLLVQCGPVSTPEPRTAGGSNRGTVNLGGNNSPKTGTNNAIREGLIAKMTNDPTAEQLAELTMGELKIMRKQRASQNLADQNALELFVAQNAALCEKLETIRSQCVTSRRLQATGTERQYQCTTGDIQKEKVKEPTIEVVLKSMNEGNFYLIASAVDGSGKPAPDYQSTPFGLGKTAIKFSPRTNFEGMAPEFGEIYKISLRPYGEDATLPAREEMSIEIWVDGKKLLSSGLADSDDTEMRDGKREYIVSVASLVSLRYSDSCRMSLFDLNSLKDSIRQTVEETQAKKRLSDYADSQKD